MRGVAVASSSSRPEPPLVGQPARPPAALPGRPSPRGSEEGDCRVGCAPPFAGVGAAPQGRLRGGRGSRRPGLRLRRVFTARLRLSALPELGAGAACGGGPGQPSPGPRRRRREFVPGRGCVMRSALALGGRPSFGGASRTPG